jgi:hypothetical protein
LEIGNRIKLTKNWLRRPEHDRVNYSNECKNAESQAASCGETARMRKHTSKHPEEKQINAKLMINPTDDK